VREPYRSERFVPSATTVGARREHGPRRDLSPIPAAQGLPDSQVGTFTQALYDEALKGGWVVISMKNDWKQVFAFAP
jgi:hypothetical protein